MSDRLYVGVDGGGTRARAVVIDDAGRELARTIGPSGLVDPRDPAGAAAVIADLARSALEQAGGGRAASLCCGLAGAGRPQEREAVRVALALEHVADEILVVGDAEAAMVDAFPDGEGVLLVAGTGSIAWARRRDGTSIRVGGWGMLLGDEGSGYDIGLQAMRAVARAHDGRSPATALTKPICDAAGVRSPDDLITWSAGATKAQIGALAPIVLQHADADDAARTIRADAVDALLLLTVTAARRADLREPAVALTGGLIARGRGPLRPEVRAAIERDLPGARILERDIDAAIGAARICLHGPGTSV